jgi:prepilin-type processing-associated H-X9-DG protein
MRDDLIGFVLGALDSGEQESIRRRVAQDQELQRQVQLVERCLYPLAPLRADVQPPSGLAARTCACLTIDSPAPGAIGTATRDVARVATPVTLASRARSGTAAWGADRMEMYGEVRQWTLADFVVAAGVCLAAACLFFPALSNSRYNTQLVNCQNNMRQLGSSLASFSENAGGYFPVIPARGNLSFAGAYAPMLASKGLIEDGRVFLCPSKGNTLVLKVTLEDVTAARGPQLVRIHRIAGGDYAYVVGYVQGGRLHGIRNRHSANAAILADAPLENLLNGAITTHARGQNVLFADGHVHFLGTRKRPGTKDDLFYNDRGYVRAGLHANDFVLAPSPASPLPVVDSSRDGQPNGIGR